jgi:UMF1 family MFS transporter
MGSGTGDPDMLPAPMSVIRKLNPFAGLPNAKEVWAWGMFDLANQSFTLLINTLLFAVYFKEVVVNDEAQGDRLWAILFSSSMFLVVLASPVIGAIADARCWRKEVLMLSGMCCIAGTCGLALVRPDMIWLAALLYIPANFMYQIGENALASFLSDVATSRNVGRISATGWTMGYVGALCLLALTFAAMLLFGLKAVESWRPFFLFAGIWFLLGMIPSALFLKEHKRPNVRLRENVVADAFVRMGETVRHAANYRQLSLFLIAFFVYAFGIQTVIAFASILARKFGFADTQLVLFVAQITLTAGIASAATSFFQDRIGAKLTIQIYLVVWIISTVALAILSGAEGLPEWLLWVIGNGIGFGLGGTGTASRAMVARFTPRHKAAEFFGLWAVSFKLAAAIGVLSFGLVKSGLGDTWALVLLAGFFVAGFLLLLPVSETRGVRAAQRATREYERLAREAD